ncbi:DoxX family membrane protein [Paracidobacterium acidisoli]|uniref:DoxX family membrane protein n=1 Tax=Paracidobacterium acidisoli TaxID=2303751 RepID=A0A372IKK4_9BACT|nr:DoxX family membrane protein [Paracidobacterium acidisoli]MBT9332793.1 DoxX family membrane protein [Paracidobacterium acidisoli]
MKIAALIARILVGLIFLIFGLNGFLNFIPSPPMPGGMVSDFLHAFMQSHYAMVVSAFQIAGGALLLVNRYVPLGIALLAPIVVNILSFHLLLYRPGISVALVTSALWLILAIHYRQYFACLFVQKTP